MLLNLLNAQNVAEEQSRFVGFGEVALYALLGFATVFLGIAFLIFVVWGVGKILEKINAQVTSQKEVSDKAKKDIENNANKVESATQVLSETEEISEETIAIITAAIMAYYEKNNPKCEFTLKRIKRI